MRTAALALLTWTIVALTLHLRAERSIQLSAHERSAVGSAIAHEAGIAKSLLSAESSNRSPGVEQDDRTEHAGNGTRRTAVVVARTASDDAMWLDDYFPQWEKNIYSVGDRKAKLKPPKNKGRESMVYLT